MSRIDNSPNTITSKNRNKLSRAAIRNTRGEKQQQKEWSSKFSMRRWRNECQQEAVYRVAEKGTPDGEEACFFCSVLFLWLGKGHRVQKRKNKTRLQTASWLPLPRLRGHREDRGGARWPGHVREHRGTGVCKDQIKARMKIQRLCMSEGDSKKMPWRTQGWEGLMP